MRAGDTIGIVSPPDEVLPSSRVLGAEMPEGIRFVGPPPRRGPAWRFSLDAPADDLKPRGESFCPFHDRCPYTMPVCVEERPPLFRTSPDRAVSCYLYRESPVLPAEELSSVFAGTKG